MLKGVWGQVERRADADVERTVGKSMDNRNEEWRQVERRTNPVKEFGETGRKRAEKGGKGGVDKNIRR